MVDDYDDALEIVATYLRLNGHEVETAADGERGLELVASWRPEVVLLDVGLPGIDGYEVARRVRAEPWGKDLYLVAMTGWGQEADKRRAAEAGFDAHPTNPPTSPAWTACWPRARPRAPDAWPPARSATRVDHGQHQREAEQQLGPSRARCARAPEPWRRALSPCSLTQRRAPRSAAWTSSMPPVPTPTRPRPSGASGGPCRSSSRLDTAVTAEALLAVAA